MNAAWVLAIVLLGQTASAGDAPLEKQVAALVAQFDAGTKADRDAAERRLLELGPNAISALPPIEEITGAEARLRIARVRQRWEHQLAESSKRASTVTLVGTAMSLADVFAMIERQTGNRLKRPENTRDLRVTLELKDAEFWQAIDQVLDQTALTTYGWGRSNDGLRIVAGPPDRLPRYEHACYSGPFRIAVKSVQAIREFEKPKLSRLEVKLGVEWEPRLQVFGFGMFNNDLEALDDSGRRLEQRMQTDTSVADGSTVADFDVHCELPPRDARRLARLRGLFQVQMLGAPAEFRFPHVASVHGVSQRIASARVTLEKTRLAEGQCTVSVLAQFADADDALDSYRGWIYRNPAWLESPNGERTAALRATPTLQAPDMVRFDYTFQTPGNLNDYTFVYRTPTAILKTTVPFEFKDLPLP